MKKFSPTDISSQNVNNFPVLPNTVPLQQINLNNNIQSTFDDGNVIHNSLGINFNLLIPRQANISNINQPNHQNTNLGPLNPTLQQIPQIMRQVSQLEDYVKQLEDYVKQLKDESNQKDQLINTISQIIRQQSEKIEDQYNEISNKSGIIQRKDNIIRSERNKKRTVTSFLFKRGFSNPELRECCSTFDYGAEIRTHQVHKITPLNIGKTKYRIGQKEGKKTFYFTNTSKIPLEIYKLSIVRCDNNTQLIGNGIFEVEGSKNSRIIYPDQHFSVTFKHPIKQRPGYHKLCYRLCSRQKLEKNTNNNKDTAGFFGETISFGYHVHY